LGIARRESRQTIICKLDSIIKKIQYSDAAWNKAANAKDLLGSAVLLLNNKN
jgi:hypothetical protein